MSGGAFLKKLEWTSDDGTVEIVDAVSITVNKSTEIRNNLCTVVLRNAPNQLSDDGTTVIGTHIDSTTNEINFQEEDELQVWALFTDDPTDFEGTDWTTNSNNLGNFILEDHAGNVQQNSSRLTLRAIDTAFHLFNKVYTFSYGVANNFTAPGIIRHICRQHTEATSKSKTSNIGTHNDTGTAYILNSKFVSEGGYIEDYRRVRTGTNPDTYSIDAETQLDGGINDVVTTITVDSTTGFESAGTLVIDSEHIAYTGTNATQFTGCTRGIDDTSAASHSDDVTVYQGFPLVVLHKIWKPLFEWIGELSQTENTNFLSEITEGGTKYFNRAFMFWIDKDNEPHFFYPDDKPDLTITLGEEGKRGFVLDKSVFDAINMVIYNSGEDMYGNGIVYYWYDETSDVGSLKMRYQPMSKIVHSLIDKDLKVNTSRETTNPDIYKQFPTDGSYPITSWAFSQESTNFRALSGTAARTSLTNDADYNDSLREAAKWIGLIEAKKITRKRSGLRYKGQITLKGQHINPGDLIQVTNPFTGQNEELLRVLSVNHRITMAGWEVTLEVQEDEKVSV